MQAQRVSVGGQLAAPRVQLPANVRACRTARGLALRTQAGAQTVASPVTKVGSASVQGTSRKQNEDRLVKEVSGYSGVGQPVVYAAVFDGHGGSATSEWLTKNLQALVTKCWTGKDPEGDISEAFRKADVKLLQPQGGFLGLGERGVGGSKCGSTAAVVIMYPDSSGKYKLLSANVGDARIILVRGGKAVQLTEDHVPDNENERYRIEYFNPNPKMPLVRYVGGTWRVGGLLALSRAFGDAYLKSTLQFEGVPAGSDGYSSGFGVIAEPFTTITDLTAEDTHLIVCSDGLFANEERGGGGGLPNDEVAQRCAKSKEGADLNELAYELVEEAQAAGSTDDVTLIIMRLQARK